MKLTKAIEIKHLSPFSMLKVKGWELRLWNLIIKFI